MLLLGVLIGLVLGWVLRDVVGDAVPSSLAPASSSAAPSAYALNLPLAQAPGATPERSALPPTLAAATDAPTSAPTATPEPTNAPPTPSPVPLTPSPTPAAEIVGYTGYIAEAGDTLAAIAANGGSTPDVIAQYNLLNGEPIAGQPLIVPQLAGQPSVLESAPILVERGRTDRLWVALTLDAGASAEPVPGILQTLRERNVKITFFLTGKWTRDNPELARQIAADGHEIANHSFNHPDFRDLDDAEIRQELNETDALIREITGASSRPFFRPPYGAYNQRVLQTVEQAGYLPIYWTFDSLDSVGDPKSPDFLVERITGHLPPEQLPGAIILAHCGSQPTADALSEILDRFAAMGVEVKKVSDVLGG